VDFFLHFVGVIITSVDESGTLKGLSLAGGQARVVCVYLKEREIQKIKIEKNISYLDARRQVSISKLGHRGLPPNICNIWRDLYMTAFHDQTFGIENSELDLVCIGQPSFCMGRN
jgi:hypothetical protein